ncbi:hypothetical protein EJ04DRAFT_597287 [Polyplosphaeria fusca]|uniref:Regulatory P domain-containing protein n=1 Tax=Polyplosphaeria fusca TaxID=682080 RepID=A0A9P4QI11_9PLEO|nr:hypothetical protein EJ04DRAFT_597287 [Polyplosphaeria fusca]
MRTMTLLLAALAAGAHAIPHPAKQIQTSSFGTSKASVASAAVSMETLMREKLEHHSAREEEGAFALDRYDAAEATTCSDGKAGEYKCKNVDMMGFLRHQDMGSSTRAGNDIWGQTDGTAFVEVLGNGSLVYVGRLPTQTVPDKWRDIKVIGDFAYIGSEAPNHGIQIFDLKKLLTVDISNPTTFSLKSLTGHFAGFGSSHNIVANEQTNMIYAVGTDPALDCRGGLWMIDVSDPAHPRDAGCVSSGGYVHDAQCVIYKGPGRKSYGHEICFNYNEDRLVIVDVTDRARPLQISSKRCKGVSYTHQGWLATDDMTYLLLDDEMDEWQMNGYAEDGRTTTYIVDVQDLEHPVFRSGYKSSQVAIDHNQYVVNGVAYQANYGAGLRIVDVSSLKEDFRGRRLSEIGYFDCRPEDDESGGETSFDGAWSVYPFFKSGYLLLNSIERGVYSLKLNRP